MVIVGGWRGRGQGNRESVFNRYRVAAGENRKVSRTVGGDGCTTI